MTETERLKIKEIDIVGRANIDNVYVVLIYRNRIRMYTSGLCNLHNKFVREEEATMGATGVTSLKFGRQY